jgi:hypothetical protein
LETERAWLPFTKGKSVDTSMGFTPAGGMMMGTRPGDLDPGVAWYMMKSENLTPKQFNNLINHESGSSEFLKPVPICAICLLRNPMISGLQKQ